MIENPNSIALVTPLRDEIDNIKRFLSHLEAQTVPIKSLVIVENDSTDGSKEYLATLSRVKNIERVKVINMNFEDTTYRVGAKYASIVARGMDYLAQMDFYDSLDFIGILDCDVFPEKEYYEKLTTFLKNNPRVGISSGVTFTDEGKRHAADINFVRGNCRLWKMDCFKEAGYLVVPTADTVSIARAHLEGWKTKTLKSAHVTSREINVRLSNQKSKGYHAYFRGHTLFYALFKSIYLVVFKRNVQRGVHYFIGYSDGMLKRRPRIKDRKLMKYFRFYLIRKLFSTKN